MTPMTSVNRQPHGEDREQAVRKNLRDDLLNGQGRLVTPYSSRTQDAGRDGPAITRLRWCREFDAGWRI